MTEAFSCLDRGDISAAEQAAERLKAMRHSSAFEIRAEIHLMRGESDLAVAVLEEGVKAAPGVWLLWQSLGNAHTFGGRFPQAQEAYARALQCSSVDASSVHFNRGMAFARDRHFDDALEAFGLVTSTLLRHSAATFKLALYNDLHRFDQVVEQGSALLYEESSSAEDRARIHAQLARAYLLGYDDREKARQHAEQAVGLWPHEPTARNVLGALERLQAG